MVQKIEMSWKEQYNMYNALEKDVIIGMLISANRHLENIKPTVGMPEKCFYMSGTDTSMRCIYCNKLKWEHEC